MMLLIVLSITENKTASTGAFVVTLILLSTIAYALGNKINWKDKED
jgi:hypothetical protein